MRRIAVTGSNGTVGRRLCSDLARDYDIVRIDRIGGDVDLDVADLAAVKRAFHTCAAVVHLAAEISLSARWEEVHRTNITGTYNVFEAARQEGCRHVIFASSNHVVGGYETALNGNARAGPLPVDVAPRPDSLYAVSKVFGEALGRYYSDAFGLRVACVRIGSMNEADSPKLPPPRFPWQKNAAAEKRLTATWFSHRDFGRLVRAVLEREVPFATVYGVGDNVNRFWDLAPSREAYGFLPLDGVR